MKTSIIICTYNEEKTIFGVVAACCKYNSDSEIIVVDDGSTDKTDVLLEVLSEHYTFRYLKLQENKGKSYAMVHGIENAGNEVILFFDADLSDIKKEHFKVLLNPIYNEEADMVLGAPSETIIDYRINPFKSLTGQRSILKKDLLPIINDIREIRFGVETYINLYIQSNGKRIKYVLLRDLKHPTKYSKTTPVKATKEFMLEGQEIFTTYISNLNLMMKIIQNKMKKTNNYTHSTITQIQNELYIKIKSVKEKVEELNPF